MAAKGKAGLVTAERGGYRLQWKDDGTDYPQLLEDFKAGRLKAEQMPNTYHDQRQVYRVEAEGRRYIIK
ncbi:MAG: hypothetical protein LBV79_01365, partial [Candidatus Adiutrix sp.]|nr:hypothetical protein [Candidatus Adiutrix sp.]